MTLLGLIVYKPVVSTVVYGVATSTVNGTEWSNNVSAVDNSVLTGVEAVRRLSSGSCDAVTDGVYVVLSCRCLVNEAAIIVLSSEGVCCKGSSSVV